MATDDIETGFIKVKDIRETVKHKMSLIRDVSTTIQRTYIGYINTERIDFFGLDSLLFQNKLIELEEECLNKVYCYIDNRMYGDYYKLFGLIQEFLQNHLNSGDLVKEFEGIFSEYPIYKDLDKFKIYEFDVVNQIHSNIVSVIEKMEVLHQDSGHRVKGSRRNLECGMNIDNYVIHQEHMNENILAKTILFKKYLSTYHNYHFKMMSQFHERIDLFYQQINEHIHEDGSEL